LISARVLRCCVQTPPVRCVANSELSRAKLTGDDEGFVMTSLYRLRRRWSFRSFLKNCIESKTIAARYDRILYPRTWFVSIGARYGAGSAGLETATVPAPSRSLT